MGDGVHEVRLAQSGAAEEEEWVVSPGGILSDGAAGGGGKFIVGSDHEGIKSVLVIEQTNGGTKGAFLLGSSSTYAPSWICRSVTRGRGTGGR